MRRNGSKLNVLLLIVMLILLAYILKNNKDDNFRSNSSYDAVVIVVGNTKYSPEPNFSNISSFEKIIKDVFYNTESGKKANVTIISATENPKTIEIDNKYDVSPAANEIATKENLNLFIKGINKAVSSSPSESGADYFEAIRVAAESVKNASNPIIIIYGSGLSDSGVLNFAFDNLLEKYNENNDYVRNLLEENGKIKNGEYNNIPTVWYGAGQVVGKQKELKEWINVLKNIYEDALSYLGLDVSFEQVNVSSSTKSVESDYEVNRTFVDTLESGDEINLTERYAEFYPDKDTLKNATEVTNYLTDFSKKIINANSKIKVVGYQTTCATTKDLGYARAKTIANILISLGVSEDNIEVDGVAGPPDNRIENPKCGSNGIAGEHRTVKITVN